ncbi:MAG TPA: DUF4129 domain-containing protein [Dehalococcoidia bacterium]|nr:DUF4129 domain-containing protein [Dehalococcoidia bacterium]
MSRRLVLDLSFLLMESLALFVVCAVLTAASDGEPMVFPAFFAAEAGGFFLVRGLLQFELPRRTLVIAGGLVSLLGLVTIAGLALDPSAWPPGWPGLFRFLGNPGDTAQAAGATAVYGIAFLIVAWGRGIILSQVRLERPQALRSFTVGLGALVLGLLAGQGSRAQGAVNAASIPLVAFSLLTLALLHLREARPDGTSALRGPWLLISAGTIAMLALAGAAIGVLPLGPAGWFYDHAIEPVLAAALVVIIWIVIVIAYPFAWLIAEFLANVVGQAKFQPPKPANVTQEDAAQQLKNGAHGGASALLIVLFKLVVVLLVVVLISYLAYRLFYRLHRAPAEGEEREALEHEGSLRADLLSLLGSLLPRRGAKASPAEPELPDELLRVRRLYLHALDRAQEHGHPRPAAATPDEFEPELAQALAGDTAAAATRAFVAARYGRIAPDRTELQQIERRVAGR